MRGFCKFLSEPLYPHMKKAKPDYKIIAKEIIKMAKKDQQLRKKALKTDYWDAVASIDKQNTARMKEIVEQIGWPTISKVGEEASGKAWLLVQHADDDVEFQSKCLKLMKQAPADEVNRQNIAYLEDRILVHNGKLQLYGTQFYTDKKGTLRPKPIKDRERLDYRRKQMGLSSFAEYEEMVQKLSQESN